MPSILFSKKRANTRQAFTKLYKCVLTISSLQFDGKDIEIRNIIKMVEFDAVLKILNSFFDIFSCEIGKSSVRVEDRMLRMHQNAVVEKCQTD